MILIGSRALLFRAPNLLNRKPKDFDFISREDEAKAWMKSMEIVEYRQENQKIISEQSTPIEFELLEPGKSNELLEEIVSKDPVTLHTKFGMVPNINLLFTLKKSHRYLKNSPHFWKTARDYHCLKHVGAEVLPEYVEFFKLREKETYAYKHPNLNVKKTDFFTGDGITYVYDHDSIHEAVKINDQPAYQYYQKDGAEVMTSKDKFLACPENIRLSGVLEESAVLALERSLIPFPDKLTPEQAFRLALSKVCSSITSGWFREYAYEHIFEVLHVSKDYKFWDKFQTGLNRGIVKPHKQ